MTVIRVPKASSTTITNFSKEVVVGNESSGRGSSARVGSFACVEILQIERVLWLVIFVQTNFDAVYKERTKFHRQESVLIDVWKSRSFGIPVINMPAKEFL